MKRPVQILVFAVAALAILARGALAAGQSPPRCADRADLLFVQDEDRPAALAFLDRDLGPREEKVEPNRDLAAHWPLAGDARE